MKNNNELVYEDYQLISISLINTFHDFVCKESNWSAPYDSVLPSSLVFLNTLMENKEKAEAFHHLTKLMNKINSKLEFFEKNKKTKRKSK